MNKALRALAVICGLGILGISIFWSQDGFNFDLAGTSGYGDMALFLGYFLAVCVSVIQFVFSTRYSELNATLKFFGILAYVYSIYTNYFGVVHFQGYTGEETRWSSLMLALVLDGVAEPLIGWGLYESKTGDMIGNLIKTIQDGFVEEKRPSRPVQEPYRAPKSNYKAKHRPQTNRTQNRAPSSSRPQTSIPQDFRSVTISDGDIPEFLKQQTDRRTR